MMKRFFMFFLVFTLIYGVDANAQRRSKKKAEAAQAAAAKPEMPKRPEAPKKGPKPYKDVIDSTAVTQKGLHTIHKVDDKYYFEIPESLFGKEIIAVTRYSKVPAGGGVFGGEEVSRQVLKWEKGPNDNIFLRSISYVIVALEEDTPMAQSVDNSSSNSIIANFEIAAINKTDDGNSYVIDLTNTFNADFQPFSLGTARKQRFNLAAFQKDKSFIQSINTFPINTEVKTVKTFSTTPPRPTTGPAQQAPRTTNFPAANVAGLVTFEMNTSFLLLPEEPMRKRIFDPRVGYFTNGYSVFGEESHKSDRQTFAVRWKLEPKSEDDIEKIKRGELVEPKTPIVYYIDPATPKKWQKYIKAGIDDWQAAFEEAGWKNAIRGEYWPEDDSTMSTEDARFAMVRYFAADIQNAYGPNVHDPRTGQILESHIGWYHNVMSLLRNWYLIQTAAVDPNARKTQFSDELMGELIRFVSSHEVGHTLGLRHNMGASSATPVEKLRDAEFQAKYGHTPSIMDYARFNYVAQPEDSVKHLFPSIGDYDKWAIKWGYSYFPDAESMEEEKAILHKWTTESVKNPRLRFGTETSPHDPRYQTEDLGDNAMLASEYGIRNLKRILPNLEEWSSEAGEGYSELDVLYSNVVGQFRRYMGHVTKNVGGIYDTPMTYDTDGTPYEIVPKATQKEAVSFLNAQLFDTPKWLIDQDVLDKIKPDNGVEAIKSVQSATLNSLMAGDRALRLIEASSQGSQYYSLDELYTDLKNGIFSELKGGRSIEVYRRNLQKVFVDNLIKNLNPAPARTFSSGRSGFSVNTIELTNTDLPSIARGNLIQLRSELTNASGRINDRVSKFHVQDLIARINDGLTPKSK